MSRRISIFAFIAILLLLALNASPYASIGAAATSRPTSIKATVGRPTSVRPTVVKTATPAGTSAATANPTQQVLPTSARPGVGLTNVPAAPAAVTAGAAPGPILQLTIASGPGGGPGGAYQMGHTGTFTITVTNRSNATGPVPAGTELDVKFLLPPGFGYDHTDGSGGGSPLWVCSTTDIPASNSQQTTADNFCHTTLLADLQPSVSTSFTFRSRLTIFAVPNQTLTATVSTPTNIGELDTQFHTGTLSVDVLPAVDLAINKIANFTSFVYGQSQTYTIQVQNNGKVAAPAGDVTVIDTIPSSPTDYTKLLQIQSITGADWTCPTVTASTATCHNINPINIGATVSTLTVTVIANQAPGAPTSGLNSATVGDPNEPSNLVGPDNSVTTQALPVHAAPHLTITKATDGATFLAGSTGLYTLTVTADPLGGPTAGAVTVTDVLPSSAGGSMSLSSFTVTTSPTVGLPFDCTGTTTVTCTLSNGIMSPGDTAVIKLTVSVPPTFTLGAVQNTATVTTPNDAHPGVGQSSAITTNVKSINVSVTKSHPGPFTIDASKVNTGTYTITIKNNGTGTFALDSGDISVVDTLPAGLEFDTAVGTTGAGWAATPCTSVLNGDQTTTVTCPYTGPLAVGASAVLTLNVFVLPPAFGTTGSATNSVTITTANNVGTPTTATDPTIIQGFDLTIDKIFSPPLGIQAGTNGAFILTVHNIGTTVATSGTTKVTDPVPTGFTIGTINSAGWDCTATAGQNVSCTYNGANQIPALTDFPPISIPVVPALSLAGTTTQNIATVANDNETRTDNDQGVAGVKVLNAPPPSISVKKSHTDPCTVGSDCPYLVTVKNTGQVAITQDITVVDAVPNSFTLNTPTGLGSTWTCSPVDPLTSKSVSCTANTSTTPLAAGGTLTFTVHATPTSTLGTFVNVVTANTAGAVQASFNDTTHVQAIQAADLAIAKSHQTNMVVGQPSPYTITLSNAGSLPITGTVANPVTYTVLENLPGSFQFIGFSGTGWDCVPPSGGAGVGTITCTLTLTTSLAAGATLSSNLLTITVKPQSAGPFTNQASVSAAIGGVPVPDGNLTNNTANDDTTVTTGTKPDITIIKAHVGATFTAGQPAQYTITVTNKGSASSNTALTVSDTLPADLSIVSASGAGWTCDITQSPITCTNPANNLGAGQSLGVITLVVNVASSASGQISNKATVTQPPGDADPNNNSSTDIVPVQGVADIAITKSHSQNFQIGANGTYTIHVTNNGSAATTSGATTVTDTLPSIMTVVTAGSGGWSCDAQAGQTLTCHFGDLSAGQDTSFDITVHIAANATTGTVHNIASVVNTSDTTPGNNTADDATFVSIGGTSDLQMTLSPNPVNFSIGGSGSVTATIKNVGLANFNGAVSFNVTSNVVTMTGGSGGGFTSCTSGSSATCGPTNLSLVVGASAVVTLNFSAGGSATSGTITAQISPAVDANVGNDTATITANVVVAPPASSTTSTIKAFPNTNIQADGQTTTTVTVTLLDASSHPVGGKTIVLSTQAGNAGLTITPSSASSDSTTGVATFAVSSALVQTVTFVATDTTDNITITKTPPGSLRTAQFVQVVDQNAINGANSTISANPTSLALNGISSVTVHVVLNSGAVAVGAQVVLSSNVGNVFPVSSTPTTNSNGDAFFQLQSNVNQTAVITAQATTSTGLGPTTLTHSVSITWGTGSATLTPTPTGGSGASGSTSSFTTSCSSVASDTITKATLTATLRNGSSTALAGKTITVTWNPVLNGMNLSPTSATTDSNGNAAFTVFSATQGGPVTFTATDTTDSVAIAQTVSITFTAPGSGCVATTTGGAATPAPGTAAANAGMLNPPSNGPSIGVVVPFILCVRSGPGTNYPAVGRLQQGTQIVLVGKNPLGTARNFPPRTDCQRGRGGATWFEIQLENNQVGWVSAFYIRVRRLQFRHLPIVDVPGAAQ